MRKLSARLAVLVIAGALSMAACESQPAEEVEEESAVEEQETEETTAQESEEEEVAEEVVGEEEAGDPLAAPADVAQAPEDAQVEESGLATKVLVEGTGDEHPTATSTVTVHYTGWTTDGERFDSSVARGAPTSFPLNQVIAGWTEGVQLMVVGEKRRFWIPEEMAYGGQPGRPAGMLVFDVELIEIN